MNARERRLPVAAALRPWIAQISVASYARDDGCPLIHPPEPTTTLVWRATTDGPGEALVVGPRTHASYHLGKDIPLCLRLRIRHGSVPSVLGVPADELVDRVVALPDLVPFRAEPGHDPGRVAAHVQAALLARMDNDRADTRARDLVYAAAAALATAPARVGDAARRVGVSERQLRTVFTRTTGLSPKQFARLSRVRTVLRDTGRRSLARLASDAGYYDQSHMTAEFRQIMHVTPKVFAEGRLPATAC
ncbi:AraC family transcriptional regulator [Actinophytocola sediminis]